MNQEISFINGYMRRINNQMKRKFTWRINKRLECPISYFYGKEMGEYYV